MTAGNDLLQGFQLIPSSIWGITGDHGSGRPLMELPAANGLFIHHTVTPVTDDPCHDARIVCQDGIARFGMLSYSWLFHPSGVVLAGQETRVGAHTKDHNTTSFGLAAIGTYTTGDVPLPMVKAMCGLALVLKRFGVITAGCPVRPHRAVKATACAGDALSTGGVSLIQAVLASDT